MSHIEQAREDYNTRIKINTHSKDKIKSSCNYRTLMDYT